MPVQRLLPDGKGGKKAYACKADYELIVDGESRELFMSEIGFLTDAKNGKYERWVEGKVLRKSQTFTSSRLLRSAMSVGRLCLIRRKQITTP